MGGCWRADFIHGRGKPSMYIRTGASIDIEGIAARSAVLRILPTALTNRARLACRHCPAAFGLSPATASKNG
jgi:hypothetical protein